MTRVAVIGAGAIGSLLGAKLHEAGHEVLLVARGRRLEFLRREGVLLSENGVKRRVPVRAVESVEDESAPDHVIIATKAFQLPGALALLTHDQEAAFGLLTVQNGVEAPHLAQLALPQASVFGARMHGFFELEDDVVRHAGVPASVVMGPDAPGYRGPEHQRRGADLAAILQRSEIPAELVPDVRPALWDKFLMAATIGGLAPAVGLTVGQVASDPAARALLQLAMQEVAAIAAALGIALPDDCVAAKLDFISRFPPDVTSSLQRDLEARRPSEFAHLTGAIPRFAAHSGVPAPTADQIIEMLRARGLVPG